MATVTIYAEESDATLSSFQNGGPDPYEHARAGLGEVGIDTSVIWPSLDVGQSFDGANDHRVLQSFLAFDTSVLGPGAIVRSVTLSVYGANNMAPGVADFIVEARLYDWGIEVGSGDYRPGDEVADDLLLATFDGATFTAGSMNDFISESPEFVEAIDTNGFTRLYLVSEDTRTATPATDEFQFYGFGSANRYALSEDPQLVIDYLPPFIGAGGGEGPGGAVVLNVPVHLMAAEGGGTGPGGMAILNRVIPMNDVAGGGLGGGGSVRLSRTYSLSASGGGDA